MVTMFPQQSPQDQSQFSYPLPPLTLTPALVGLPQMVNTGLRIPGWIVVYNESPYQITVQRPSDGYNIPIAPQTVDKLQLKLGDTVIYITPKILLPQAAPSSVINFQVYYDEPKGTYPMELTRQAAATSGATNEGFTTRVAFSTSSANSIGLNLFNPANNSINMQMYSMKIVVTVASATPFAQIATKAGANLNWLDGTTVPNPNDTKATSNVLPTIALSNQPGFVTWDIIWELFQWTATGTTQVYEFVPFPDLKQVPPGTNVAIMLLSLPATGATGAFIIKHTER